MGSRSRTGRSDTLRVDPECFCVIADEADGYFSVFDGVERIAAVFMEGPVFDRGGNHTSRGKIVTVRDKLGGRGNVPHPTMEEKDDGAIRVVMIWMFLWGEKEMSP